MTRSQRTDGSLAASWRLEAPAFAKASARHGASFDKLRTGRAWSIEKVVSSQKFD